MGTPFLGYSPSAPPGRKPLYTVSSKWFAISSMFYAVSSVGVGIACGRPIRNKVLRKSSCAGEDARTTAGLETGATASSAGVGIAGGRLIRNKALRKSSCAGEDARTTAGREAGATVSCAPGR